MNSFIKKGLYTTVVSIYSLLIPAQSINVHKANIFNPLSGGNIKINGFLGERLDSCIKNGVMSKEYDLYVTPFSLRNDDSGSFQGEFWGKWFTSAALAYGYQPSILHKRIIDDAVYKLMDTQTKDGKISSYKNDFGDWDIWGRKYALLGLIAYYDQTGDKKAIVAASKALDYLISVAGPGKKKLTETGVTVLEALSSSSILEPIVLLYQRTGKKEYLQFAEHIVSLWNEPSNYNSKGLRLIEDALSDNVDPIHISAAKGYEEMSCYEGLCDLYRVTGKKKYLDAAVNFGNKVIEKEIMIVGSGSSAELWCDGAVRQTELLEQPMETCVTVTWLKFCYQLLRLTGDAKWADEMEITLYNALLGSMTADGNWWAYFSPLLGERMPSPIQVPTCNSSCCIVNGPRGLLTAPFWSVMITNTGPVINTYVEGEWKYEIDRKNEIIIKQTTSYPKDDEVTISLQQKNPVKYTLKLRIPSWSKNTSITINNQIISEQKNGYIELNRLWKDGDSIKIKFDMRGRIQSAPGNPNMLAIMRGPIVLALDNRFVKEDNYNVWLLHDKYRWKHDKNWNLDYALLEPTSAIAEPEKDIFIELNPISPTPEGAWIAFEVPFLYRPTHIFNHKKMNLVMCDYLSAGNEYSENNLFRVWLPQPLFLNYMYPKNSWRLFYDGFYQDGVRPKIPNN